jgi:hypothetical protein
VWDFGRDFALSGSDMGRVQRFKSHSFLGRQFRGEKERADAEMPPAFGEVAKTAA